MDTSSLRLVFGDQLSPVISSLNDGNQAHDTIMLCEVQVEATYVKHHKKKIAFVFSAMRHFAEELTQKGFNVRYIKLDDPANTGSFFSEVERAVKELKPGKVLVTEPSEYRVHQDLQTWESKLNVPVEIRADDRFLCSNNEFAEWAKGRKQLRMEYFYREMRQKHNVLMAGKEPEGGQWNYDAENRKPPKAGLSVPKTYNAKPDSITLEVLKLVEQHFADHFGDLEPFFFAVTRKQALAALRQFIKERLNQFGDYQDAMVEGEPWMYHSHISFYLNCGLLSPKECIEAAEQAYRKDGQPLNAVEGFIRQILGWREFVRGLYWLKMPGYEKMNFFDAKRKLPGFYWTGQSSMNCLNQCIQETKKNAYAHHIQRLMVLGNFALLAGLNPDQVNEWFLVVYADAYQWVELPNVTGMILFADGGLLASKPYAAGGSYIKKMSNYCKGCQYKVAEKNGTTACPFNYLYWDFLARNRDQLQGNPRVAMMYRTYDKMAEEKKEAIRTDAKSFLMQLD